MKYHIILIWLCICNQVYAQIKLPDLIGAFEISSIKNIELSDTTRIERGNVDKEEFRKLKFDIYYPTDNYSISKMPYWEDLSLYVNVLDSIQFELLQNRIKTNTSFLGDLSSKSKKYPLIIFSPGWQASRFEFTILMEQLASMGNIVAILDHPFIGYANIDGILTEPTDQGFKSYEDFRDYLGADQLLVLEYLMKQNRGDDSLLSGRIDNKNIVSIGQSTGFLSTKGAALIDSRITKCISLDASLGEKEELQNLKQDILLISLERTKLENDFSFKDNLVQLNYEDAGHFSISDWTFLKKPMVEKELNTGEALLYNYAENINLFIKETTLSSFVAKAKKYPNLNIRSYSSE